MIDVVLKLEKAGLDLSSYGDKIQAAFFKSIMATVQYGQNYWVELAQSTLRTSRMDYIKGLRQADSLQSFKQGDKYVFLLQLVGEMPNRFEFGWDAFDMKTIHPGWLWGSKAKVSSKGKRYVVIPFIHQPKTSEPTGMYSGKAHKANLQQELKRVVSQYKLGKTVYGRSMAGERTPKEGYVARVPKGATDVHSYLQGLTRVQKTYVNERTGKKTSQGKLMTFRVMHEESHGWLMPAYSGAKLLPKVERKIEQELDRAIDVLFR